MFCPDIFSFLLPFFRRKANVPRTVLVCIVSGVTRESGCCDVPEKIPSEGISFFENDKTDGIFLSPVIFSFPLIVFSLLTQIKVLVR